MIKKITILPSEKGQIASEDIMLNVDTFKNLYMLAKTDKVDDKTLLIRSDEQKNQGGHDNETIMLNVNNT
jgi:hypothetical protein